MQGRAVEVQGTPRARRAQPEELEVRLILERPLSKLNVDGVRVVKGL